MLSSAPLIVLICLVLAFLKGQYILYVVCFATLLYCIRRHTFKPAQKRAAYRKAETGVVTTLPNSIPLDVVPAEAPKTQRNSIEASNVVAFPNATPRPEVLNQKVN
jgi:hypothetical protein